MSLTIQHGLHHKSVYKSCRIRLSEIFFFLLCYDQEPLLGNLRRKRAFGYEDKPEAADDLIDNLVVFVKGDGPHLVAVGRTEQRFDLVDFSDNLRPTF